MATVEANPTYNVYASAIERSPYFKTKKGIIIDNTGEDEGPLALKTLFNITEVISYKYFNEDDYTETVSRIETTYDYVVLSGSSVLSARNPGAELKGEIKFIAETTMHIFGVIV